MKWMPKKGREGGFQSSISMAPSAHGGPFDLRPLGLGLKKGCFLDPKGLLRHLTAVKNT